MGTLTRDPLIQTPQKKIPINQTILIPSYHCLLWFSKLRTGMIWVAMGPFVIQITMILGPSPFKTGQPSPLRRLSNDPRVVKVDLAHTYAIGGFGKDDAASIIVFLAVRCGLFGPGGFSRTTSPGMGFFQNMVCKKTEKAHPFKTLQKRTSKITSNLVSYVWAICFLEFCFVSILGGFQLQQVWNLIDLFWKQS